MKWLLRMFLFVPVLLMIVGVSGCPEDPIIIITAPEDGAVLTQNNVTISVEYENAETDTLEILLNGEDITSQFTINENDASATISLDNDDYDVEASVENSAGTQASVASSFTVDAPIAPYAASIEIVSGNNQTDLVGLTLADDLLVLVKDQFGDPFQGAIVNFNASAGSVAPGSAMTGADGQAASSLTLPTVPGGLTVNAEVDGTAYTVAFTATALTGPAANLAIYSGDNQNGLIGELLADPLVVIVTDAYSNPVDAVDVTFSSADGTLNPELTATGADGLAQTEYTLGLTPGTQNVTATVVGFDASVQFIVNAGYIAVADSIDLAPFSPVSADDAQVTATATVLDQFGNPLSGQAVLITSTIGVAGATNDNGNGTYSALITDLTTVGSGTVTAQLGALSKTEDLQVIPGAAFGLTLDVPDQVDVSVGTATALATLTDQHGNGIPGVTGTITSSVGSVGPIDDLGNGSYRAEITGLTTPGVTAEVTATFAGQSATGYIQLLGVGTPATLVLSCDTPISADDATSNCSVRIEDQFAQGVAGETVIPASTCASVGAVSDDGNGDYSFVASGLTTAGLCNVAASIDSLDDNQDIEVLPGVPASATLAVTSPVSADDAVSSATASFFDANSNPVPGLGINITATSGTVGTISETGTGVYEASITGLTAAGTFSVEAVDPVSSVSSGLEDLVVLPGLPAALDMTCDTPVNADYGASECPFSVVDQNANPIAGLGFDRSNTCGAAMSVVTDLGGGNYIWQLADLRTAGTCSATATATTGSATDTENITVEAGDTFDVTFSVATPVNADAAATTLSATFTDEWGNAKEGLSVTFNATYGTAGATSELGGGAYEATLSGLYLVGSYSASVLADGITDAAPFTVVAGVPANMSVTADSPIPANGTTPSNVEASLTDQRGNALAGQTVSITTTLGTASSVSDNGNGTYSATVVSGTDGTATVTASSGAASDQTTIVFTFVCNNTPSPAGGTNGCPIEGTLEVTVIDDETKGPIAGAFVQAGLAPDDPFTGNSGTTDAGGVVTFADPALDGSITITAGVAGSDEYTFLTVADVNSSRIVMPLKKQGRLIKDTVSIQGDVGGFDLDSSRTTVDAGIVIPSLDLASLLTLNLDSLLAPEVNRSLPLGQSADIPGNIYAPEQSVFLFVNIEIAPYLGLQVERNELFDMYCIAGRVDRDVLLDLLTNPDAEITDIIGYLSFRRAGVSRNHTASGNSTINFSMDRDLSYNLTINLDNTPADSEVYMVSAADIDSLSGLGKLVPMGFTAVNGGTATTQTLTTVNTGGSMPSYNTIAGAAALLGDGVTTQVQRTGLAPGSSSTLNSFYDVLTSMSQLGEDFSFADPENGVSPALDLQISSIYLENLDTDTVTYQWDVMADDIAFTLPELDLAAADYPLTNPASTPASDLLEWEASGYGLTLNGSYDYNYFAFDGVLDWLTHFTYNKRNITFTK